MKFWMAVSLPLALGACYSSPSDLIGDRANLIERTDAIFSFNGMSYFIEGAGRVARLCSLSTKADLTRPCVPAGTISIERTGRGNYIVQLHQGQKYSYGVWFRSEDSPQGRSGLNCFSWLGDGIVGSTDFSLIARQWQGTEVFARLTTEVRKIATEPDIDRRQLLKVVEVYENTLSPIIGSFSCVGTRINQPPQTVQIAGDNRHLRDFEPGKPTP